MKKLLTILIFCIPILVYGQLDTLNVGTGANTGTGEKLRPAFLKINRAILKVNEVHNVKSYGAKGDGVTDDTGAIQAALNSSNGSVYFPSGNYAVNKLTYDSYIGVFTTFSKVNGISILGDNANIIDIRDMSIHKLGNSFSPVFVFDSCQNITIKGVNYICTDISNDINDGEGDEREGIGYSRAAYVLLLNNCENINLEYNVYNARYGVKTGDYNNYSYNGSLGVVNLTAKISAVRTGYPVSIEMGNNINLNITVDTMHRAVYLCGTQDAIINVQAKNQFIGNSYVLLSDTRYMDGATTKYRGCSNIRVNVSDIGSTVSANTSLFEIQTYGWGRTAGKEIRFGDIKFSGTVSKFTTQIIRAFILSGFDVGIADVIENVELEYSTPITGYAIFRITTDAYAIMRNFTLKNITMPTDAEVYLSLGAKSELYIEKSVVGGLYFYNKAGGKVYMKDSKINIVAPLSAGYTCSTLYLNNNAIGSIGNPEVFPAIYLLNYVLAE